MKKRAKKASRQNQKTLLPLENAFRIRRMQRLCYALDIDMFAASIILNLRDQLDAMERNFELLRARRFP